MSVVIDNPITGKKELYLKGADSTVFELCSKSKGYNTLQHPVIAKTYRSQDKKISQTVEDFSNEGLRTLAFAKRTLDDSEFDAWTKKYEVGVLSVAQ